MVGGDPGSPGPGLGGPLKELGRARGSEAEKGKAPAPGETRIGVSPPVTSMRLDVQAPILASIGEPVHLAPSSDGPESPEPVQALADLEGTRQLGMLCSQLLGAELNGGALVGFQQPLPA